MNKKDISEIRRQFKEEKSTISRICCCYVDHEKNKLMETNGMFLTLPEEELFKYFEIFKKTLSGTLGKNMMNIEFPLSAEGPGTPHENLVKLVKSRLEDEQLVSEFFDRIIENFTYLENYLIILVYGSYDVPGKGGDSFEMFDASENVYSHILCSICPVNLSKPGLSYNGVKHTLETRTRDWVVDLPMNGFLFPAFNDRTADIHSILYYSAKPDGALGIQPDFIEKVLGNVTPMTAGTQKETFQELVETALGEEGDFETMKSISLTLAEMVEANKGEPEPLELSGHDVKNLLEGSGISAESLTDFEEQFEEVTGNNSNFTATNIAETRKFSVETPGVVIKASPEFVERMEMRYIGGRSCLIIPVDEVVQVNGITVRSLNMPDGENDPIAADEDAEEKDYSEV